MKPYKLKRDILYSAIQGKVTEQLSEDGTGAELLTLNNRLREQRIVQERLKKGKESKSFSTDDYLFDIPENWAWSRFGDLVVNYDSRRRPVTKDDRKTTLGLYDYYGATGAIDKVDDYIFDGEFLMIGEDGGNFFVDRDNSFIASGKFWANNHVHVVSPVVCEIRYLKICLDAYNLPNMGLINGIAVPKLNQENLNSIMIPVPPLAEQKRIVAKIEELLPYIDCYEQAWSRLEDFNRRFPVDMQKSILQMAIQGKLVEQRSEEGTGEALFKLLKPYHSALKPCKDELDFSSMDFDLPESWVMAELNQLFDFVDYRGKTPTKITEGIFLVTASNIRQGYMDYTRKEYISPEEYETRKSRGLTERGDLLFTTEAPMGNAALCDLDECSCGQRIITFKAYREHTVFPKLFMYFILSPQFQQQLLDNCTGTTAKGIKADKLKHFLIPLPPLAEQKRIVAKLEEILPLCDGLK